MNESVCMTKWQNSKSRGILLLSLQNNLPITRNFKISTDIFVWILTENDQLSLMVHKT